MDSLSGRLDGFVIFRFSLTNRYGGGGVEEHLKEANRLLLERNRMTILQTYLADADEEDPNKEELIGRGRLIWAPMQLLKISSSERHTEADTLLTLFPYVKHRIIRDFVSKAVGGVISMPYFRKKNSMRFFCQAPGLVVTRLFQKYAFHLAILHSFSSLDDVEIVSQLVHLGIPFAVIHHFENHRLAHPLTRMKLKRAASIGGVSAVGLPRYLQSRFIRIHEGVDTEFFQVERASPLSSWKKEKSIFLPARIESSKGQLDLIKAVGLLNREGLKVKLVLAGRTDSHDAERELTSEINCLSDPGQVLMLGQIDCVKMRDWYATCKIVALPSYSEGLPRVLLEAQSMKRPVVAYKVGGVSEAIRHGETGFLVRKGDIRTLAARLQELLDDENMRERMGEYGRSFVKEEFSMKRLAESHEELYLSALARHDLGVRNCGAP